MVIAVRPLQPDNSTGAAARRPNTRFANGPKETKFMPKILTTDKPVSHFSAVLDTPAASPEVARAHYLSRLAVETDVADLLLDLQRGQRSFTIVDTRSAKSFEECHIPGAINLPRIDERTTADLAKDLVCVVYCWGLSCNGSTKGAAKLNALGFRTKELMGGIEYWRKEGGAVEGTLGNEAPMYWSVGA
jgi:rhodanese-related sulfurtransferase